MNGQQNILNVQFSADRYAHRLTVMPTGCTLMPTKANDDAKNWASKKPRQACIYSNEKQSGPIIELLQNVLNLFHLNHAVFYTICTFSGICDINNLKKSSSFHVAYFFTMEKLDEFVSLLESIFHISVCKKLSNIKGVQGWM